MKLADFNRLKKMMALTFSDNEHEAIAAMRASNAILKREGLTWDRVLDRVVQVIPEVESGHAYDAPPPSAPQPSRYAADERNEINEAFAVLREADLGNFAEFIGSLQQQWRNKGSLTDRQKSSLFKAAAKERSR